MVRTRAGLSRWGFSGLCLSLAVASCGAPAAPPVEPSSVDAAQAAARELFERGERLAREGDSVRAEQYLAAALREGHDPEQVLPLLMRVCLTGSRLRAALNHASPYLKQHPDAIWLRYLVANVYLGLRQPMRAREHLFLIEAQSPEHAPTQYLLGLTEWESFGNREAAERHFQNYLRLDPEGQYAAEVTDWLRVRALHANSEAREELAAPPVADASSPVPHAAAPLPDTPPPGVQPAAPAQPASAGIAPVPDSRKPGP